jgi:predicted metalloprotease with PDZ domain
MKRVICSASRARNAASSQHRWVSEGFAQYYQNVLLARSGTYDPLTAWQKLYDGLERGRQSRPELSPNEATAGGMRNGRMKIYWSGAAIALMADVALRERSGGAMTLDDVMGRLQACCLPSDRTWTGPELFATLDTLAGAPVFMPLYRRYADTAGFPDTRPLFERLGLNVSNDKVRLRRGGELEHIRSAITQWDDATAARRAQLAGLKRVSRTAAGTAGSS